MSLGPFGVEPSQIAGLGATNFGRFVNSLLSAEAAKIGLSGPSLVTTYKESVPDGGVDAAFQSVSQSQWIPAGHSAWQFKSGDQSPGECATEITGATRALEIIRAGGKYRLVVGVSLTEQKINQRKKAIDDCLSNLGCVTSEDTVRILTADSLARWTEEFPALALTPILNGVGHVGQSMDQWTNSILHKTKWCSSDDRNLQIESLRGVVERNQQVDVHICGPSGLGKTRFVMEALKNQSYESLVIYCPSADQFSIQTITHLQNSNRTAILVIDECEAKQHKIFASVLQTNTNLKLITIGLNGDTFNQSPMIALSPFSDEGMSELLKTNQPNLWIEAIRVIVEVAAGNIDYALKLAKALLEESNMAAGTLVTANDIRHYLSEQLPGGSLFLACSALALFTKFGFEREKIDELEMISDGLGISMEELNQAVSRLTELELLNKQGRYRGVGPHPVSLYLASVAWNHFNSKILSELMQKLNDNMVERLFLRAVDLGKNEAIHSVMSQILSKEGPFSSLQGISTGKNSKLLINLAVLEPQEVSVRILALLESTSDVEIIEAQKIRRDLVWSLEKLAWHSNTFGNAANSLLKLAINESEKFSNSSTGAFVSLFGTRLPATAASPDARMSFLWSKKDNSEPRIRMLVAKSAAYALSVHEAVAVSGEVQGGVIVEPRGVPETNLDVWRYQMSAIDLLCDLVDDNDPEISKFSLDSLTKSIHASLFVEEVRNHLARCFSKLNSEKLKTIRLETRSLELLFQRVENVETRIRSLEIFKSLLPIPTSEELLWVLAQGKSWEYSGENLVQELISIASEIDCDNPDQVLLRLLEFPVSIPFEIGRAVAFIVGNSTQNLMQLRSQIGGPNIESLIGYLRSRVEMGEIDLFDSFLEGLDESPSVLLGLTVTGPRTQLATARVDRLVPLVNVEEGSRTIYRWTRDHDDVRFLMYLKQWLPRVNSQNDYNSLLDVVSLQLHSEQGSPEELDSLIEKLLKLRDVYPDLGQQEWAWTELAKRLLISSPLDLFDILINQIASGSLSVFQGSEIAGVLSQIVEICGSIIWNRCIELIHDGSWRMSFAAKGWLGNVIGVETVQEWVGESAEKARTLASVSTLGETEISEVGRFLIRKFGTDERVSASLAGDFVSGFWSGPRSEHMNSKISLLVNWASQPNEDISVKSWLLDLANDLEGQQGSIIEFEQEGGW